MAAKILVVDDYAETLAIYRELFEMQGYQVAVAASDDEARARLVEMWPSLVIIDDDPSRMPGVDLIARLRDLAQSHGQKPFSALAIRGDYFLRRAPALPGFDFVVSKPLDFDHLDALVKQAVLANQ